MTPQFICHKDFENQAPICVFHKQKAEKPRKEDDERFLNRHILFRKRFEAGSGKAILKITADDYYKLYINGCFVTQGPAASYPQAYNYNEIDVTPFMLDGENLIAVHTYYQGLINRVWVSGDRRACLWCELTIDGKSVLTSDTSWKCHDHTGFSECGKVGYDTAFMECYDSRSPEAEFYLDYFDDSDWENAAIYKNADYTLRKQETASLELYRLDAEVIEPTEDGVFLDFGREAVGYIAAMAKGESGDTIILRYGEELNDDGSVRYKMRCKCVYEEKWILSGEYDYLNQFDYKAFRYAELILPDGVEINDVYMLVRHYPFDKKAIYNEENEQINEILTLCSDTIKYSTQENFVDCPTREKGQYLGDVSIAARAHATLTRDTAMMKKAIRDFCESTFICRGMMAVSSAALMQEIADYSLQFPAQVLWVYKMDGDIDFVRECEPYVTGIYEYFLDYVGEDGLIRALSAKWNLVDWPENLRDGYVFGNESEPHNVLNAFWYGALVAIDEIYALIEKERLCLSDKVKESFIKTFYNKETGLYSDDVGRTHSALHSNILPLLFDIGTEDGALKERLISFIKEKRLTSVGVYMAYFALAALKKHGQLYTCRELIADEGCWLNMLREGATTTFEAWGKDQKWNTSLCHPWATAPAIILAEDTAEY